MECLVCALPAKETETIDGISIRTCPVGHRTGITPIPPLERIDFDKNYWEEIAFKAKLKS